MDLEFKLSESNLLRRIMQVSEKHIAEVTGLSTSKINEFVADRQGLKISQFGALFQALDLIAVDCREDLVVISKKRYAGLLDLAGKGLEAYQTDLDQSGRSGAVDIDVTGGAQ